MHPWSSNEAWAREPGAARAAGASDGRPASDARVAQAHYAARPWSQGHKFSAYMAYAQAPGGTAPPWQTLTGQGPPAVPRPGLMPFPGPPPALAGGAHAPRSVRGFPPGGWGRAPGHAPAAPEASSFFDDPAQVYGLPPAPVRYCTNAASVPSVTRGGVTLPVSTEAKGADFSGERPRGGGGENAASGRVNALVQPATPAPAGMDPPAGATMMLVGHGGAPHTTYAAVPWGFFGVHQRFAFAGPPGFSGLPFPLAPFAGTTGTPIPRSAVDGMMSLAEAAAAQHHGLMRGRTVRAVVTSSAGASDVRPPSLGPRQRGSSGAWGAGGSPRSPTTETVDREHDRGQAGSPGSGRMTATRLTGCPCGGSSTCPDGHAGFCDVSPSTTTSGGAAGGFSAERATRGTLSVPTKAALPSSTVCDQCGKNFSRAAHLRR